MSAITVTECPLCGSPLQATALTYYDNTEIVVDKGRIVAIEYGDAWDHDRLDGRIYCDNDHEIVEILAAIENGS